MRLAEVPTASRGLVFRSGQVRAVLGAGAVICAAAALIAVARRQRFGFVFDISAALLLLGLVLMRGLVLARFRPSNWLVRTSDDGLFIQFRSYLNHRLPEEDRTVVFVPYQEIRSARLVRERRDVRYREAGERSDRVSEERRRLVELELAGESTLLSQALAAEAAKRDGKGTVYLHSPVQLVSASRLRLEWKVVPGPEVLLGVLPRPVRIDPPADSVEGLRAGKAS